MRALVLAVVAACSSKEAAPTSEDTPGPCDAELSEISGALEATLAGGADLRGDAFEAATAQFAKATLCGPDMAQIVRDLRDHFKAGGDDGARRALLVRFGKEASYVASARWRMPAKLAVQIDQARAAK